MTDKLRDMLDSRQAPGCIVRPSVAYRSPIDGAAITTRRARRYDLESHNCVDAREGAEMAADARRYWQHEALTVDDIRQAAEQLGTL